MFAPVSRWLPLALVVLAAVALRTHDLARRPMHADEANQAMKTGELLEHGRYAFDPRDHHGPTLYYAALPVAWVRGETSLATLTETTVRLVPALAGVLGVVLLYALALPLGHWLAVAAAAFMAVAPASVYYSRYFIQEALLVSFTLALLLAARRWWITGRLGWALAAGSALGLMQSTKASAPLFALVAVGALLVVAPPRCAARRPARDIFLGIAAALFVAAVFYSSFGTHFAGLRDAVMTYGFASARAVDGSGHEKPWWYFFSLFGWLKNGGLVWQQVGFSLLAVAGLVAAFFPANKLLRGVAVYTTLIAIALALTPYKTPWHVVHLVPGFALLAAGGLALIPSRPLAFVAAAVVIALQLSQTRLSSFLRPADARNPYAYVHSVPDVLKVRGLAEAALARVPGGFIRVISEEYWPLPWYLRAFPRVGYWTEAPANCDGALVIASATQAEAVRARLQGNYRESYLGLRPGFLCVVFTPAVP